MEHIVQFAISMDDEAIKKKLEERGYEDIINKLMCELKQSRDIPKKDWSRDVDWERLACRAMGSFIEEHKDEIIDAAAAKLCESYKRTKAYREKMAEAMDILKGEN